MTHIIRVSGFILLGAGALLYVASLGQAYVRGGILAIIERITNFIPETWLIVICLAPGMALLMWARERGK
jgi:hypothetical protein